MTNCHLGCVLWPLEHQELLLLQQIHPGFPDLLFHLFHEPYTSSLYSSLNIIVKGSANKADNIIQVGMKSLKKIPESDNSLSIPLSPAPLHSSPQRSMPFSPAHLQLGDATVLNILPSSALSPSKKSDVKVAALRNSQHQSFLCSHQQASLIYFHLRF